MQKRSGSTIGKLGAAVAVSTLLHVPIVFGLLALFPPAEDGLAATRNFEPLRVVEEPDVLEPDRALQIVSLDKPDKETPAPDRATVEDRYNQKVEKETVRKRDVGRPGARVVTPRRPRSELQPAPRADEPPDEAEDPSDVAAVDDSRALEDLEDKAPPTEDSPGELDARDILPNMDNVVGDGGREAFKDYLDVPEGEKDLINRKQTRYWSFFDRMKRGVQRQWQPNEVYQLHDPRRQVYGVEDRMTVLKVTLEGDGSVRNIVVEKPSGVPFLDNEAKRAFRAASPFPNPPEGLKDDAGQISLRFGFFLDIESRGTRIIRFRR